MKSKFKHYIKAAPKTDLTVLDVDKLFVKLIVFGFGLFVVTAVLAFWGV